MFKRVSAKETKAGRVICFSSDLPISEAVINRIQKDSVVGRLLKNLTKTSSTNIEVTVTFNDVGAVMDDLRSLDPATFDRWLGIELTNALLPRKPRKLPEKPRRGPFDRMDIGTFGRNT